MKVLNEEIAEFITSLSDNGKIYFLSKMAGITVGCVDDTSALKEEADKLAFSAATNILVCSMTKKNLTTTDKILIETFMTEKIEVPTELMNMVNMAIDSMECIDSAPEEHDVMFV